jgi:hypothetical protein
MKTQILFLALASLLFTGCASIVDGGPKTIHLNSNPEGAKVTIFDKHDKEIAVETTPGIVALERGGFYSKDRYRLLFEMPGYYPYEMRINPVLDGWYWGNVVWGVFGLTGGAIAFGFVDPATGDMWTLSPRNINCNFVSTSLNLTPEEVQEAQVKANPELPEVPVKKQNDSHK